MPTCRDIITLAARRGAIIKPSAVPKSAEADYGLEALKGYYEYLASSGVLGRLTDVRVTDDYTAKPGERVRVDGDFTVTLPASVEDGGTTYPPFDLALVDVIYTDPSVSREISIYEAGRGDWVRLDSISLDDEAPLASRSRTGLADSLAMHWLESFGSTPPAHVTRGAVSFAWSLTHKLGGDAPRTAPDYY